MDNETVMFFRTDQALFDLYIMYQDTDNHHITTRKNSPHLSMRATI